MLTARRVTQCVARFHQAKVRVFPQVVPSVSLRLEQFAPGECTSVEGSVSRP
jgi:hypothetical protein